jgi:hypothetical protein
MEITLELLEKKLVQANAEHQQIAAALNAKIGEIQTLEHLIEIAKQPSPTPAKT